MSEENLKTMADLVALSKEEDSCFSPLKFMVDLADFGIMASWCRA